MQEKLNDLAIFIAVAREGSFTRAAVQVGSSQSAVSQTVSHLENRLQVKLLHRTTRSVTLTEAGERLLSVVAPAIDEIQSGLVQLSELRGKPAGTVRISADEYAVQTVLWPKLKPFLMTHPDIKLELSIDYGQIDIAKERFDAGVRRGGLLAKDMIAVPISGPNRMTVVASPNFLTTHNTPKVPADLTHFNCINLRLPTHGENLPWMFSVDGNQQRVKVNGQLVFNSVNQVLDATLAGFGLAFLPHRMVEGYLAAAKLVAVLEEFYITHEPYYLYYTSRLQSSAAFQLVRDTLKHR